MGQSTATRTRGQTSAACFSCSFCARKALRWLHSFPHSLYRCTYTCLMRLPSRPSASATWPFQRAGEGLCCKYITPHHAHGTISSAVCRPLLVIQRGE